MKAVVLGATGMVGQRFLQLLTENPWFEIRVITTSEKSIGKTCSETTRWMLSDGMPKSISDLEVQPTDLNSVGDVDVVFSSLPAEFSRKVEENFAKVGYVVVAGIRGSPALGGIKYVVLGRNTIRGAAGCAVLNVELLKARGHI